MKKSFLLLPTFFSLLCSCSIEDLMFWKKNQDSDSSEKQDDDHKEDEGQGEKQPFDGGVEEEEEGF